jgi:hypothetical protein
MKKTSFCLKIILVIAACLFQAVGGGAMDMKLSGDRLIMSGTVTGGECSALRIVGPAIPQLKFVILRNSHGGVASEGYCVGELIRELGLSTAVSGYCFSSCSRMFLGGVTRHFTDDYPPEQTRVGLHGNYDRNGDLVPIAPDRLRPWIIKYSDGKVDKALLEEWIHLPKNTDAIWFYNSERFDDGSGASVQFCEKRGEACRPVPNQTAYSNGIANSSEIISSKIKPEESRMPAATLAEELQ